MARMPKSDCGTLDVDVLSVLLYNQTTRELNPDDSNSGKTLLEWVRRY